LINRLVYTDFSKISNRFLDSFKDFLLINEQDMARRLYMGSKTSKKGRAGSIFSVYNSKYQS
jgi:hypothetical protein